MRRIHYTIQYGGYVGAEDDYYVDVPDDATEDEIRDAVQKDYEQQVLDNCCWEIDGEEDV